MAAALQDAGRAKEVLRSKIADHFPVLQHASSQGLDQTVYIYVLFDCFVSFLHFVFLFLRKRARQGGLEPTGEEKQHQTFSLR